MSRQPDYILQGEGYLKTFADYAIHYGDVALLLTDQQSEDVGVKEEVISALDTMGLRLIIKTLPSHWPSIESVKQFWAELDAEYEPNIVISLGNSPIIHFAKALSIMAPFKGHVHDLFLGKANIQVVLPHLTIPLMTNQSREDALVITETVSIYDFNDNKIDFSHRELVPKLVGYEQPPEEQVIRRVS